MRDIRIIEEGVAQYRILRKYKIIRAASPIPDQIIAEAMTLGPIVDYTHFIVYRIAERGIPWDMMDHALTRIIGPDWKNLKCTDWIDRIEMLGISDFGFEREWFGPHLHDSGADEPPLTDVLTDLILKYENGWWRE